MRRISNKLKYQCYNQNIFDKELYQKRLYRKIEVYLIIQEYINSDSEASLDKTSC